MTVSFDELYIAFFTTFNHFIDITNNQLMEKIINILISNKKELLVAALMFCYLVHNVRVTVLLLF